MPSEVTCAEAMDPEDNGRKARGAALAGVIYPVPTQRKRHTTGDSPLPTRRQPDKEGKCGKNCISLPTTRLLDFPAIAWPNSLSLLDDLIRWSAQKLDDQIRSISARISNHAASTCGAKRHGSGQGHRAGQAKSAAGCPKPWLGTARHQKGLGYTRTVKIWSVISWPHNLSSPW